MATNKKTTFLRLAIFALIMLAIMVGMRLMSRAAATSTKYDGLAQCLADKEVKLYGAFWCTHCADQKKAFGASAAKLPYVECSNPDHSQTATCTAAGVQNRYPTWQFPDGTMHEGGLKPAQLAAMSGCSIALEAAR
jgi:hypothetical protein